MTTLLDKLRGPDSVSDVLKATFIARSLRAPYVRPGYADSANVAFDVETMGSSGEIPRGRSSVAASIADWLKLNIVGGLARPDDAVDTAYMSRDAADAGLRHLHAGARGLDEAISRVESTSDEATLQRVALTCVDLIVPQGDGTYSLDFTEFAGLPIRGGRVPLGCKTTFDETRLLTITHLGIEYTPAHPDWESMKTVLRSTVFVVMTFYHSFWYHANLGSKIFIATHRHLPAGHPLQRLLLPYVHGVEANMTRARFTVFGPLGALWATGNLTRDAYQRMCAIASSRYDVKMPDEYPSTYGEPGRQLQAIWKVLHQHVTSYFACHPQITVGIDAWRDYVARNSHARYGEMNLVDAVTHIIFALSIKHYVHGHVTIGDCNPENLGTCLVRYEDGRLREERTNTNLRVGVILSILRPSYKFIEDHSGFAQDAAGQAVLRSLHADLTALSATIPWLGLVSTGPAA